MTPTDSRLTRTSTRGDTAGGSTTLGATGTHVSGTRRDRALVGAVVGLTRVTRAVVAAVAQAARWVERTVRPGLQRVRVERGEDLRQGVKHGDMPLHSRLKQLLKVKIKVARGDFSTTWGS